MVRLIENLQRAGYGKKAEQRREETFDLISRLITEIPQHEKWSLEFMQQVNRYLVDACDRLAELRDKVQTLSKEVAKQGRRLTRMAVAR